MEVNFDTYPGYFNCNISWGDCELFSGSQIFPYGYYAEPSSFFNSYLPNFNTAYGMMMNEELNGTIWMNGFQSLHMHGRRLNCNFLCFPSTANHISIANSIMFNGYVNFQTTEWYNVHYNNYTDKKNINQFNVPLIIKGVTDFSNAFRNCPAFNKPVADFENCYYAVDCSNMFNMAGFTITPVFNQAVNIPSSVINTSNMFASCLYMNSNVHIPFEGPTMNCSNMFARCGRIKEGHIRTTYDGVLSPETLPSRIVDSSHMFTQCGNVKLMPEIIWDVGTLHTANWMFNSCTSMNAYHINIPAYTIQEANGMFNGCNMLNPAYNVELHSGLVNTQNMFAFCDRFNVNVNFGLDINNATNMFRHCWNYNLPLNFEKFTYLNDASNMYRECRNLDQYINIDTQIYNSEYMFSSINVISHDITINNACNVPSWMFSACNLLNMANINIVNNSFMNNTHRVFHSINTMRVDNVFVDNSCFHISSSGDYIAPSLFYDVKNLYINNIYVRGNSLMNITGFIGDGTTDSSASSKNLNIGRLDIDFADGYPYYGGRLLGLGYGRDPAKQGWINEVIINGNNFYGAFSYSSTFAHRNFLHINHINVYVNNGKGMFDRCRNLNTICNAVVRDCAINMFRAVQNSTIYLDTDDASEAFAYTQDCNIDFTANNVKNLCERSVNCVINGVSGVPFSNCADMFYMAKNYSIDGGISDITVVTSDARSMFENSTGSIRTIRIPRSDTKIGSICANFDKFVTIYTNSGYVSGTTIYASTGGNIYVPSAGVAAAIKSVGPFYPNKNQTKADLLKSGSGTFYWYNKVDHEWHKGSHDDHWNVNGVGWPDPGENCTSKKIEWDNLLWTYSCGIINVVSM